MWCGAAMCCVESVVLLLCVGALDVDVAPMGVWWRLAGRKWPRSRSLGPVDGDGRIATRSIPGVLPSRQ
jgi:hypothetical protein